MAAYRVRAYPDENPQMDGEQQRDMKPTNTPLIADWWKHNKKIGFASLIKDWCIPSLYADIEEIIL
jgi:hypothetical protein